MNRWSYFPGEKRALCLIGIEGLALSSFRQSELSVTFTLCDNFAPFLERGSAKPVRVAKAEETRLPLIREHIDPHYRRHHP